MSKAPGDEAGSKQKSGNMANEVFKDIKSIHTLQIYHGFGKSCLEKYDNTSRFNIMSAIRHVMQQSINIEL